jgi:hypothetical protein
VHQVAHRLLDHHTRATGWTGAKVLGDGLTIGAWELAVDIWGDERIDERAIRH